MDPKKTFSPPPPQKKQIPRRIPLGPLVVPPLLGDPPPSLSPPPSERKSETSTKKNKVHVRNVLTLYELGKILMDGMSLSSKT